MTYTVFMIAGEPSGDTLGAALMNGLRTVNPQISILGIGGKSMQAQGLKSLLSMNELSVMGLWEILGHLPRLLKLIQALVEEIETCQPDIFVSIDLPDFNFRVAKLLKKRGIYKGKIIHYVAPSVWAWRSGRAKKVSKFLDGLMCLFPFEPAYFKKYGLKTEFVGHPLIEINRSEFSRIALRKTFNLSEEDLCLGLFLGSREKEIKNISATLLDSVLAIYELYPDLKVIVPTLPHIEFEVMEVLRGLPMQVFVVCDPHLKWQAISACDVALAVSGTVGLELAYAGVPHVVAYKMNPLTALILKHMVKVKYAHLINIMLDQNVVPECIQGRCDPKYIFDHMISLITNQDMKDQQRQKFEEACTLLSCGEHMNPSHKAAQFVMSFLDKPLQSEDQSL